MEKIKVLLTEGIHEVAQDVLEQQGFVVKRLSYAPGDDELQKLLAGFDAVGIRSKSKLKAHHFEANPHLSAVGCFCIGTNQVDLESARDRGVPVFNAPYSNTRSVAELVLSNVIALARHIGDINRAAHSGQWVKSAKGRNEIRGKTLGIVGYGHIGSQVSILAEALGMKVIYYDVLKKLPLGNAQMSPTLDDLLRVSDFVTLHVPETSETKNMISARELDVMKKGSYLLNASRGTVVVIEDLVSCLEKDHIAGAAIDVFPVEPASNSEEFQSPLRDIRNVILTPHIGGSTEEAQYNIGLEVAESLSRYLHIGSSSGAVNFPNVELPHRGKSLRLLNVHRNEPGVLAEINKIVYQDGINIEGQYLSTDESIGYLIMDITSGDRTSIVEQVSKLSRSIKTRGLF